MESKVRDAICTETVRILKQERLKRRISMELLAERAGLSQAMISYVERGLRIPTLDTLLRISGVLKLELADVLARASERAKKGKRGS
jgi:transcriptional regulator with XRE-family HTH domain